MPTFSLDQIRADPEFQALPPEEQQKVLAVVQSAEARPPGPGSPTLPKYTGAPDLPLEPGIGDVSDKTAGRIMRIGSSLVPGPIGGLTAGAGSLAADVIEGQEPDLMHAGLASGTALAGAGIGRLLGALNKLRFGTNPAGGFKKVAEAVRDTAPSPVLPTEPTAQGLSDVMRSGTGKDALQASRERRFAPIQQELTAQTQANQTAAAQGLTAGYKSAAVAAAPDPAGRFTKLLEELATAGRGGFNPATGTARTGPGSLAPLRDRADILKDIEALLSPSQLARFQSAQNEYAQGSDLLRLFKPSKTGKLDPLLNQGKLQDRAKQVQDKLDPDLLKAIFRGGRPLHGDESVRVPLGLPMFGSVPMTRLAGPNDPRLIQLLLQGAGSAGLSRYLDEP